MASTPTSFRHFYTNCYLLCLLLVISNKCKICVTNKREILGGSPGLVVMGGESRSKGRGFDSRHPILDGHFFTIFHKLFVVKICNVCLKRPKINEKEAGVGP